MEESDGVQKPVVVDPPLYNEAPPSPEAAQRRPVVITADRDLGGEEEQAESSVEDPEDDSDS
ncbi:unnamed protein product [Arabis nemorensis]|uniref:Uncharacterized protein n=1 Tax=Arabis nemorensis TaxID=586526 RepID=A0A565BMG1_9BRAS|nr:unnamed protein product [Arabis nemorensis]